MEKKIVFKGTVIQSLIATAHLDKRNVGNTFTLLWRGLYVAEKIVDSGHVTEGY